MSAVAATIPVLDEVVHIARCAVHGLHGQRSECFVCGGPVEQVAMVPVVEIVGAPCDCGCDRPRRANSAYFEDACRTRHWKDRTEYVHPDGRSARNARNASEADRFKPSRPGGRQVSYRRAIGVLAGYLEQQRLGSPEHCERTAERILSRALPDKQRHAHARAHVTDVAA